MTDNREWSKMAYLFQWSVRTSCKLANANYTPYEIITGLKPRSPIDAIVSSPVEKVDVGDYVSQLVKYVKDVHKQVDKQRRMIQDQRRDAKIENLELGNTSTLVITAMCDDHRLLVSPNGFNEDTMMISFKLSKDMEMVQKRKPIHYVMSTAAES